MEDPSDSLYDFDPPLRPSRTHSPHYRTSATPSLLSAPFPPPDWSSPLTYAIPSSFQTNGSRPTSHVLNPTTLLWTVVLALLLTSTILLALVFLWTLLGPYWDTILWAVALSVVFHPSHKQGEVRSLHSQLQARRVLDNSSVFPFSTVIRSWRITLELVLSGSAKVLGIRALLHAFLGSTITGALEHLIGRHTLDTLGVLSYCVVLGSIFGRSFLALLFLLSLSGPLWIWCYIPSSHRSPLVRLRSFLPQFLFYVQRKKTFGHTVLTASPEQYRDFALTLSSLARRLRALLCIILLGATCVCVLDGATREILSLLESFRAHASTLNQLVEPHVSFYGSALLPHAKDQLEKWIQQYDLVRHARQLEEALQTFWHNGTQPASSHSNLSATLSALPSLLQQGNETAVLPVASAYNTTETHSYLTTVYHTLVSHLAPYWDGNFGFSSPQFSSSGSWISQERLAALSQLYHNLTHALPARLPVDSMLSVAQSGGASLFTGLASSAALCAGLILGSFSMAYEVVLFFLLWTFLHRQPHTLVYYLVLKGHRMLQGGGGGSRSVAASGEGYRRGWGGSGELSV